ncbi:class I SAM-dependent methyltransferase [Pseudomonas carnis]|uniref:class I SAM-dependent methyltransferase n=2 Tax=Bacteria TaxID=2 RepID=UPI0003639E08|nr:MULTISPECIES: class I SAM-dependent methyltransferase [Pseudomonas]MBA1254775.1 class I SAM-dependent methyltransferase [Pseudomonas carnis]MBP0942724.1 class I SAM-dependent methyltransferase [Pseudomonas alliivorans]MEE4880819.1 class I SAM-dependent methyltransferase [Pseudomonas alliivorans]MEE4932318.1 class I SAM-dependent methyltransferase [Pseudomonas alliivorans]MEE4937704.1 class I SAM-dependent methyltransferase [Pseudomonas alliivorans]
MVKNPQNVQLSPALRDLEHYRHEYVENWSVNSKDHEEHGHYTWMARQVAGYRHVLEIGCGTGQSTLALLGNGHTVICIEENPYCIDATRTAVDAAGYRVAVLHRATARSFVGDDHSYHLDFENDIPDAPDADCLIIEGDALGDEALEAWLRRQPKFDAVVCWLLGTHFARGHNVAIDTSVIKTAFEHRIFVQNHVYEVADEVLRSGGILNVIDREQNPDTEEMKRGVLDSHRDQASVTSLKVQGLSSTPYIEPQAPGAMRMQLTLPPGASPTDAPSLVLLSVTSVKP